MKPKGGRSLASPKPRGFEIVDEFTEIETGRGADALDKRPQLKDSTPAAARKSDCAVVVAKLEQIEPRRSFHQRADEPARTLHRRRVGLERRSVHVAHLRGCRRARTANLSPARTREALAAAKARGIKLGGPKLVEAQQKSRVIRKANADRFAENIAPIIREIQASGATSLREIAAALNARGIRSARGGDWSAVTVRDVIKRAPTALGPTEPVEEVSLS